MEREDQSHSTFIGSIAAAREFVKIIYEYIVFMIFKAAQPNGLIKM